MRDLKSVLLTAVVFQVMTILSFAQSTHFRDSPRHFPQRGIFKARLSGFQEVPSVLSGARGFFKSKLVADGLIEWELEVASSDDQMEFMQAHIHLGQRGVNDGIAVFLCTNLGNGPDGTQECPPSGGTIAGTIAAEDILDIEDQGLEAGDLEGLLRAMRHHATYVNVHSDRKPSGEIRGQVLHRPRPVPIRDASPPGS